jgi:uncharacterized UPF0146 family protein
MRLTRHVCCAVPALRPSVLLQQKLFRTAQFQGIRCYLQQIFKSCYVKEPEGATTTARAASCALFRSHLFKPKTTIYEEAQFLHKQLKHNECSPRLDMA